MTPSSLQTLLPGAAPAAGDRTRRPAPGEEAASFASALDTSVQALAGSDAADEKAAAEPAPAPAETGPGSADAATVEALALMLAAAAPVLPPPATPPAQAALAGIRQQAAAEAVPISLAADAAAPLTRGGPLAALAEQPAGASGAGQQPLAPAPGDAAGSASAAPSAASVTALLPQASAHVEQAHGPRSPLRRDAVPADKNAGVAPRLNAAAATAADATTAADGTATAARAAAGPAPIATLQAPASAGRSGDAPVGAALAPTAQALADAANRPAGETAALQAPTAAASESTRPRSETAASPLPTPAAADSPAPLAAIASAATQAGPAAPVATAHLVPTVGSADWAPALAQQIVRLPGGEVELHLNPAELGPLRVKLSLNESQAQVMFVAEHAAVRHALEAALPQLRTSFAENGISLGQATVGSGLGGQRADQGGGERQGGGGEPASRQEAQAARAPAAPVRRAAAGAVDTFA